MNIIRRREIVQYTYKLVSRTSVTVGVESVHARWHAKMAWNVNQNSTICWHGCVNAQHANSHSSRHIYLGHV